MEQIVKTLFENQDLAYRDFHSRLMPGIDKETVIGVRTPELRKPLPITKYTNNGKQVHFL